MSLVLSLPGFPRAARRELASRAGLLAWWQGLTRPAQSDALARFVVARVSEWLPLAAWAIAVPGPDGPVLLSGLPNRRRLAPGAVAAAAAALRQQGAWSAGSLRAATGQGPDAAAVAFVLSGREEEVAGVLVGIDHAPAPRPPDVRSAAEALEADVLTPVGHALERLRQMERLRDLASADDLTGLFNARHLHLMVEREVARLKRTGHPLSLVFLDLDAFKRVNDRHGHLLGSRVLVEFAQLLRACVRTSDTTVRYGGDEFVVVLPNTSRRDAERVGRRIQARVAAQTFLTSQEAEVRLTASVGVATVTRPTYSADDLIRAADEAMYSVKRSGRNGIRTILLGRSSQKRSTKG